MWKVGFPISTSTGGAMRRYGLHPQAAISLQLARHALRVAEGLARDQHLSDAKL